MFLIEALWKRRLDAKLCILSPQILSGISRSRFPRDAEVYKRWKSEGADLAGFLAMHLSLLRQPADRASYNQTWNVSKDIQSI
jgi:hypothetical protein